MSQKNNDDAATAFLAILIGVPMLWIVLAFTTCMKGGGAG